VSQELRRVTFTEFLLNFETLPKAPSNLNKKSDLTGLIFDKLLPVESLDENFFGVKWGCRCLCGGTRDVWSKNLLRGIVGDCGCRAMWRTKKRRKVAKKKRQAVRAARFIARQEQRDHYAIAKQKRKKLLLQTKAAALKRWADYRRANRVAELEKHRGKMEYKVSGASAMESVT
jgi:hypothetical protein